MNRISFFGVMPPESFLNNPVIFCVGLMADDQNEEDPPDLPVHILQIDITNYTHTDMNKISL